MALSRATAHYFLKTTITTILACSGYLIAAQQDPSESRPPAKAANPEVKKENAIKSANSPRAKAYYYYSLGHLYSELASAYGNRSDYVNKAIDNYRLALSADPSATFLTEEIAELYRQAGRLRDAALEAEQALKTNPKDLNARRVLARIYTQQIGDPQSRVDEKMLRRALDEYRQITEADPKDIDSLIMMGRLYKLSQNSPDAEKAYKKALEAEPDNEDALTGLALVYADLGDSQRATELLERLSKKSPSPRAFAALAASYEQTREYGLAANAYRKALELDSTRPELKQALAQNLALANQLDEALKIYQELVAENPRDVQSQLRISQIYRQQKKLNQAREANDKAKEIDPSNLDVLYNEVGLLESEGKVNDAISGLKQIIEATNKRSYSQSEKGYRIMLLERLGVLYRSVEQYEPSVDAFRQIAALDPEIAPRAEAQIIDTYRLAKDLPKAQQEADAAIQKYPSDRTVISVRASLLADLGKSDEAVKTLQGLLDGKNDRETYLSLAQVYEKLRNYPEMAKTLDSAEKLSKSKDEKESIYFMRGSMYERQKQYDLAEKEFRKVLEIDPDNSSALNYLGYMFADRNVRLEEARELIKRAVDQDPNNGAFLDSLGWVYFRLDRLEEAEQHLKRSLELISSDPTIHDHLGDVYFKQGKIKEAITEWQSSLRGWNSSSNADSEPGEITKVQRKLDGARLRLAKQQPPRSQTN